MKNYTKALALCCLLIFTLNVCLAQTSDDSTTVKKTVKQKKSRVFTRIETSVPVGYVYSAITPGFLLSTTVGYSVSKDFRVGLGAEYLYFQNAYAPVFANVEFGNHTKRVNASFNINGGYAFTFNAGNALGEGKYYDGVFVEILPTISFGFYKSKTRLRLSLGNQLLSTINYNPPLFLDQYLSSSNRMEEPEYATRVLRMNLLLKVGMDF